MPGRGVFRWRGVTIQVTRGQTALVAVLENGRGEDELTAELGPVLNVDRW